MNACEFFYFCKVRNKKSVGIVGTGPAGLMAGTLLLEKGIDVQFFDHNKAVARKFLVAGHGGFNLTNAADVLFFQGQYNHPFLKDAVSRYSAQDFREFLNKIKIPTYVGSSGKIFPQQGIKPISVLANWKNYLHHLGAQFHMEHELQDFNENELTFECKGETKKYTFDFVVFALGGGSWAVTGSNGEWLEIFKRKGIETLSFTASNSGFECDVAEILSDYEGKLLKNVRAFSENSEKMGDIVITKYGLEGAPIYAMNLPYREGKSVYLDFKPDLSSEELLNKISKGKTITDGLKYAKIHPAVIHLLKNILDRNTFIKTEELVAKIKQFKLNIAGVRPVDEVISTVGGVSMNEIDSTFALNIFENIFCVGEMLDWDAPTGGYLIQGAVSSGAVAANEIVKRINSDRS